MSSDDIMYASYYKHPTERRKVYGGCSKNDVRGRFSVRADRPYIVLRVLFFRTPTSRTCTANGVAVGRNGDSTRRGTVTMYVGPRHAKECYYTLIYTNVLLFRSLRCFVLLQIHHYNTFVATFFKGFMLHDQDQD